MLLAEANQWPEDVLQYFGAGDECHMAFHFPLMPRIYMAVATEDRHPITDIMRQTPEIPENCQWAVFLRNHDELTLEMVTDRERDYLWNYYAADRRARINLGIRRRLAPLMENDRRKIELLKALLMSMPGTPVFYYGDEIGMGDNVFLGDRDGVRTPMQWSFDRNGGFSRADPARLYLPPIMDPVYGFEAVNVEAQSRSPSSLLNWIKRLIAARRARRAFGRGTLRFLYPANRKVIAYLREWDDETILCVANLSRSPQAVELDLSELRGRQRHRAARPQQLSADRRVAVSADAAGLQLFLVRARRAPRCRGGEPAQAPPPEFVTLVMPHGWADLFRQHNLPQLESDVIPAFLPRQRWFGGKGSAGQGGARAGPRRDRADRRKMARRARKLHGAAGRGAVRRRRAAALFPAVGCGVVVRRNRGAAEAWCRRPSPSCANSAARARWSMPLSQDGVLVGADGRDPRRKRRYALEGGADPLLARRRSSTKARRRSVSSSRRLGVEQSNSSIIFDEYGMLKIYRRLQPGPHPEIEMSRFLVERAGFANTPPLLAFMELGLDGEDGQQTRARRAVRLCPQPGGRLDAGAGLPDPIPRRRADRAAPGTRPGRAPICPIPTFSFFRWPASSGSAPPRCIGRWPSRAATIPILRPSRSRPRISPNGARELEASGRGDARKLERGRAQIAGIEPAISPTQVLAASEGLIRADPRADARKKIAAAEDPLSRRFPSRPSARREERFLHHRFRGRAGAAAGRAAAQELAPARCRRHDPLVRLRRRHGGTAARRSAARGRAEHGCSSPTPGGSARSTAFRAAYRKAMRGCPAYPASKMQARAMIDFFTLEKAVYEVSYELANRPGWVDIPLRRRPRASVTGMTISLRACGTAIEGGRACCGGLIR